MIDDPFARTSFAWWRTVLGALAVSGLVARGLVISGAPGLAVVGAAVPALAFLGIGAVRTRALRGHRDPGAWRPTAAVSSAALVGLVALAAAAGAVIAG